jgi:hypothetical protein
MGKRGRFVSGFRFGRWWKHGLASSGIGLVALLLVGRLMEQDALGVGTPLLAGKEAPPPTAAPATPAPPSESPRPYLGGAAQESSGSPMATPSALSPEPRAYSAYMQPRFQRIADALGHLGEQSMKARRNPDLLQDAEWKGQTMAAIAILSSTGKELQAYQSVPLELERLNALMMDLGKDLEYIAAEHTASMDLEDPARIANATQRLTGFLAKAQQADAELQRLTAG